MFKRVFSLASLVLLITMASAFASENSVRIVIRPASDTIQQIRYQRGPQPGTTWKSAPLEAVPLILEAFDSETEYVFVQQTAATTETESAWGELYAYQYDIDKNSWSLTSYPPKTDLRVTITTPDGVKQGIRYQYGAEPTNRWQVADSSMLIEGFDSRDDFLFVQQAISEDRWSETYRYQYDYMLEKWSLTTSPQQEEQETKGNRSFDVKTYALGPIGHSSNFYKYVLGGGIQMNAPLGKVVGHVGLAASKVMPAK